MNIISYTFKIILYQPLFNVLILLYEYLPGHDFGIAVMALTILIRLILYPLTIQSIKSQQALSEIQPKIQEIQKKYKDDRAKQSQELISLYQKEKFNPFGGVFLLFIQLPILIALYQVFGRVFNLEAMTNLYSFVPHPGAIDPTFLNIISLGQANLTFAVLAGLTQFFQTKMATPTTKKVEKKGELDKFSEIMQKEMLYLLPLLTIFILWKWKLPAAISLYLIVTALFSIIQQQLVLNKTYAQPKKS